MCMCLGMHVCGCLWKANEGIGSLGREVECVCVGAMCWSGNKGALGAQNPPSVSAGWRYRRMRPLMCKWGEKIWSQKCPPTDPKYHSSSLAYFCAPSQASGPLSSMKELRRKPAREDWAFKFPVTTLGLHPCSEQDTLPTSHHRLFT